MSAPEGLEDLKEFRGKRARELHRQSHARACEANAGITKGEMPLCLASTSSVASFPVYLISFFCLVVRSGSLCCADKRRDQFFSVCPVLSPVHDCRGRWPLQDTHNVLTTNNSKRSCNPPQRTRRGGGFSYKCTDECGISAPFATTCTRATLFGADKCTPFRTKLALRFLSG